MTVPISANSAVLPTMIEKKPPKAEDAAKQFEALLIGQMMRSAREASYDDDDDSAGTTMLDVADQQFSQLLANGGGFGLARMIAGGLTSTQGASDENR